MTIKQDSVVTLHYTLRADGGDVIETSTSGAPLTYLHGRGNLIPGLERELQGKKAGDKLRVTVAPAEGYGEYDAQLVQHVPRRSLKGVPNVRPGMQLRTQSAHGAHTVTVKSVTGDMVTVDGNHPLAGKSLDFEVEITAVREATPEELQHGHVHGPGGHPH